MAKKIKFYTVWKGLQPGVYASWDECKKQIAGFEGAVYKSFPSREMAEEAFSSSPTQFIGKDIPKKVMTEADKKRIGMPDWNTISVDAACAGNPGDMEYQGVETKSGRKLFHLGPLPEGTVNIGEFLAIVHGLAFLKKYNSSIPIYTDSRTAMKWVRDKRVNTKLARTARNAKIFNLIERGEYWLKTNQYSNPILKWQTEYWGEIPADFGRK